MTASLLVVTFVPLQIIQYIQRHAKHCINERGLGMREVGKKGYDDPLMQIPDSSLEAYESLSWRKWDEVVSPSLRQRQALNVEVAAHPASF